MFSLACCTNPVGVQALRSIWHINILIFITKTVLTSPHAWKMPCQHGLIVDSARCLDVAYSKMVFHDDEA